MRLDTFRDDLRYAVRSLLKNPGFALVAVLTLAMGVGGNTAIFSVLHAVVLRELPYRDADRLAVLWTLKLGQNSRDGSSYLNVRDWREQSRSFEDIAVYVRTMVTRATLTGGDEPERVYRGMVGPGLFQVLGAPALLGRTLEASDSNAGSRAVVISHGLWRRRFAGDPGVIGKSMGIDGAGHVVVGVMPSQFGLLMPEVQLWQPLAATPLWERMQDPRSRGNDALIAIGRLRAGVTLDEARAELDTIAARLRTGFPDHNARHGVEIEPLRNYVIGSRTERSLWLLFGAVGCVLLIACANVANLALARGVARRHEFSLRSALGADRSRLFGQALAETLVVAILAAAVGLLLAWLAGTSLKAWASSALPRLDSVRLDANASVFALTVAMTFGLMAGLVPALRFSTVNPVEALREGGSRSLGGLHTRRLRQGLVIAELALAVILVSGAGLLVRSFVRISVAERGFDSDNVLLMQVDLPDEYRSSGENRRVLSGSAAAHPRAPRRDGRGGGIRLLHRSPARGLRHLGGGPAGAQARRALSTAAS